MKYRLSRLSRRNALGQPAGVRGQRNHGPLLRLSRRARRAAGTSWAASYFRPRATAATLRFRDGAVTVTDGPFAETKEQIGGIVFLEARDLNEAIQLISRHPGLRVGPWEIRPVEDFGEAIRASEARRSKA